MKSYKLTEPGRKATRVLQQSGEDEEAEILLYLLNKEASTAESIAEHLNMDESTVRIRLMKFGRKRWVE